MTDILVIGRHGQLSNYFCACTEQVVKIFSSKELDLRHTKDIKNILDPYRPKVIVNLSSYNDVEGAESSLDNSLINALALKELSEFSKERSIPLIHISTDYVFNGSKGNYNEDDQTDPINSYGKAKLEGENYVRNICNEYLIIRTSWLYSCLEGRNSFLNKAMEMYFSKRAKVSGSINSIGSPTSAYSLALALNRIIPIFLKDTHLTGTYHFSNKGRISRYEFFKKILFLLNNKFHSSSPVLKEVNNSSFNMKANRPEDTSLDCSKFYNTFPVEPLTWQVALNQEINKIN